MFNNIKDNKKQLGLAERIQPSATEIYTQTNIPTGGAMPNYTHTQTTQKHIIFDSTEQFKLEREFNELLQQLYDSSPQKRKEYFNLKQEKYKNLIYKYITKLKKWELIILATKMRPPTCEDYTMKLQELYSEFKTLDETIPIDKYFAEGPDDTMLPGVYLITLADEVSQERMIHATVLFSGIQWLMQQKEKIVTATTSQEKMKSGEAAEGPIKKELGYADALKTLVNTHLKLNTKGRNVEVGNKSWNKTRLIVALKHVLENRNTLTTSNDVEYAQSIASITGQDPENLRKNISNYQKQIKPYGCNLKDLNENYIKAHKSDDTNAMTSREYKTWWAGMFELIDSFIEQMNDLSPLRGNSAQNPA